MQELLELKFFYLRLSSFNSLAWGCLQSVNKVRLAFAEEDFGAFKGGLYEWGENNRIQKYRLFISRNLILFEVALTLYVVPCVYFLLALKTEKPIKT